MATATGSVSVPGPGPQQGPGLEQEPVLRHETKPETKPDTKPDTKLKPELELDTHTKLQKLFEEALVSADSSPKYFKQISQKLNNLCNSNNESITYLATLVSSVVDGSKVTNVGFVLHLMTILSKKGEVVANTITDFGSILSFLVKYATSNSEPTFQVLAMRCIANVSKWKSGKSKLPQMPGFVSYLCDMIGEGKVDETALFSISVLARLLELFNNRSSLGSTIAIFGSTTFYDAIGNAAASSLKTSDYTGHTCRLILHLSRVEQHRSVIAQSEPAINTLKGAVHASVLNGSASVSSKCAVVAVMNLAGLESNRVLLANTDGLISLLVKFSAMTSGAKTSQYCLAALLNLAWENSNRSLIMGSQGILEVLTTAVCGSDHKASMYGVGVICNLSCIEEHQLMLGQSIRPDVVAALVHAVAKGTGFTQDDAIGSLTNLSSVTLNRILIARQFEKLTLLVDYIRTHNGICRQRAVVLLQNLSTSHSSLDFFLMNEEEEGYVVTNLLSLAQQCDKEPVIAGALQYCIDSFTKRRKEIQESVSHFPVTNEASDSRFNLPTQVSYSDGTGISEVQQVDKETHAAQLFEMLNKSKKEGVKMKKPLGVVQNQSQQEHVTASTQAVLVSSPVVSQPRSKSIGRNVEITSTAGNVDDTLQLSVGEQDNNKVSESKLKSKRSTPIVPDSTSPNENTSINTSLEIKKKVKKDQFKGKQRRNEDPTPKPESVLGESSITMSKKREKSSRKKNRNAKTTVVREPIGVNEENPHHFIGSRTADLYYSSDESDERSYPKHKRKNPHRTNLQSDTVARTLFDDQAQPKETKKFRLKERKKVIKTQDFRKEYKRVNRVTEKKEVRGSSVNDENCSSTDDYRLAHPPTKSRPSSSRTIKIKKYKNLRVGESKTGQTKALPAEAKHHFAYRLKAESKRSNPVRLSTYDDLPVKEDSKDYLDIIDDHRDAKETATKSSVR
jgi:hypothetical protein